jgi:hypothetical protein
MTAATIVCMGALGRSNAQDAAAAQEPGVISQEPGLVMPPDDAVSGSDSSLMPATPTEVPPVAPTAAAAPTTPDEAGTLEQTIYGEDEALAEATAEPEAQSRPWKLNLHGTVGGYYDSNIFYSHADRQSDFITVLSGGGGLTLGDYTARENNYVITDYTGLYQIFARHGSQSDYEQNAFAEGQVLLAHLTLRGNFQFQDLADQDIDIGARARRQIYTANGSARYDISDKTFLQATGQVINSIYSNYYDSDDERGGLSFNYIANPNVTFGIGATGGVLHVQDSGSQTYEQLAVTSQIAVTGKFSLNIVAGAEDRQTQTNNALITPTFQITGDYKPFEGLDLNLGAFSQVNNSATYFGTDYVATGFTLGAAYEVSARFALELQTGYTNDNYRDVNAGSSISRNDNYWFVRPGFRYTASPHCNMELYYLRRSDNSSVSTSSFKDDQVGLTLDISF